MPRRSRKTVAWHATPRSPRDFRNPRAIGNAPRLSPYLLIIPPPKLRSRSRKSAWKNYESWFVSWQWPLSEIGQVRGGVCLRGSHRHFMTSLGRTLMGAGRRTYLAMNGCFEVSVVYTFTGVFALVNDFLFISQSMISFDRLCYIYVEPVYWVFILFAQYFQAEL